MVMASRAMLLTMAQTNGNWGEQPNHSCSSYITIAVKQQSGGHAPIVESVKSSNSSYSTYNLAKDVSLCEEIACTVAEITNSDPLDLDPLGEVVDNESLQRVFESLKAEKASFTFEYADHVITISSGTGLMFPNEL